MIWFYLFFSAVFGIVSFYHIFQHRRRGEQLHVSTLHTLKDPWKITTQSKYYRISIPIAYLILILNVILLVEAFRNFYTATILILIILALGVFVLTVLDRIFEVREDAVIMAGYHARFGRVRNIRWGKKGKDRTGLIMELDRGTKISTSVPNDEKKALEEVLSEYVYFE